MSNQSKVLEADLASADQTMSDTGFVHFDTDVVHLRIFASLLHECFAIAEADFDGDRRISAEFELKIERFFFMLEPILRPQFLKCLLLRCSQSAAAPNERPN